MARAHDLQQYVTTDEDLTLARSGNFAEALVEEHWSRTYQIGHPEVTIMWVTTVVLTPEWAQRFAGTIRAEDGNAGRRGATDVDSFMAALSRARLGMAVVHSALIALTALLVWRLASPGAGFIAGGLLALEPFLVAHGQLLRADALVAELTLLSTLAAFAYWRAGSGIWALGLSSVCFGLAMLTKTPAVLALPVILGLAVWSPRRWTLGLWMAVSAIIFIGLWPAMWVHPLETVDRVLDYTLLKGGSPMDAGSFLLGEASPDPGPLFYPIALLFRMSPVTLLGTAALIWWRGGRCRSLVYVLLVTVIIVTLAITLAPKKADRYLTPLLPLLIVLAGLGISEAQRRIGRPGILVPVIALITLATSLLAVRPYTLSYYNPLLGGGAAASRVLLIGWGEGLDQVAAYLNTQSDAPKRTAAVFYPDALDAQFVGNVLPLSSYDIADVAVLYISSSQRGLTPPALAEALRDRTPDFESRINGVPYAQVYYLPPAEFEGGITLDSIDLDDRSVARGEPMKLVLRWGEHAPAPSGWRSQVTLIRQDGQSIAQVPGRWNFPDQPAERIRDEIHNFQAPRTLGRYTVAVSVQRDTDEALLRITHRPPGLEPSPNQLIFQSLWFRVQ
ncbi:MAG: ArnT family glycosyltransferase [Chloroflexota bacterium]